MISKGKTPILEADKGYDAMSLREAILVMKIFPFIPYRNTSKGKQKTGIVYLEKKRWQVERAIAWMQRKFRRLVVRWERKAKFWEGFLMFGIIRFWIGRLSG